MSIAAKDIEPADIPGNLQGGRIFALSRLLRGGMVALSRRHAADADGRRGAAPALSQRSGRSRRGATDLSLALTTPLGPCGGVADPLQAAHALPQHVERDEDALRHRRRRLGRRRQVDDRAHPCRASRALALEPEGRPRHHRRLSLSECGSPARKPDGPQGFSSELRYRCAAQIPLGDQGGPAERQGSDLFAPDL